MDGFISRHNTSNEEEKFGTAMIAGRKYMIAERKYMIAIVEACTA